VEGVDRVEPPVNNMAYDMSAERRGPDMDVSCCQQLAAVLVCLLAYFSHSCGQLSCLAAYC
jgi:hypothetical protein